jgi:hypothetical protein
VGAKPKPVAAAALKNCTCSSQGCALEIVWDAISQTFVAGQLVGLKEFEHHKWEDDQLHLATTGTTVPSSTNQPASESDGQHSSMAACTASASPDAQTSKSTQRQQHQIFAGFNTLLDVQDKLHASEICWDQVQRTLNDLVFVHSPVLHDSPVLENYTKDASHTLNEGPYALLYNTSSNAPLIQYEEELFQLLHHCDSIVDYGDKELQDAKAALEDEVNCKFQEIEEMKAKAWQHQKHTGGHTGIKVNVIETGEGAISQLHFRTKCISSGTFHQCPWKN